MDITSTSSGTTAESQKEVSYYVYCLETNKENFLEADISSAIGFDDFLTAIRRTTILPIGTLFMRFSRILENYLKAEISHSDKRVETFFAFWRANIPFNEQEDEYQAMDSFMFVQFLKIFLEDNLRQYNKLNDYAVFLDSCSNHRGICSTVSLDRFSGICEDLIPQGKKYFVDATEVVLPVKLNEIELSSYLSHYEDKKREALVRWDAPDSEIGNLSRTYIYYELSSIFDFVLAFLQTSFNANYIIKRCEFCKHFFIPIKRIDEKYCSYMDPNKKSQTCKTQIRIEQQLKRENLNCMQDKVHKTIRTMLRERCNTDIDKRHDESKFKTYVRFLDMTREIREFIKKGNLEYVEDYGTWMKNYNARKKEIDIEGYENDPIEEVIKIHKLRRSIPL